MENEMMSLYDFLGRPAGGELGKQVAASAAKAKVGFETKKSWQQFHNLNWANF